MANNNVYFLLFIASSFGQSLHGHKNYKSVDGENVAWNFVSNFADTNEALWRQEMNHWYDQCAEFNDEYDSVPLEAKIQLLQDNNKLELENDRLEAKSVQFKRYLEPHYDNEILKDRICDLEIALSPPLPDATKKEQDKQLTEEEVKIQELQAQKAELQAACIEKGYLGPSGSVLEARPVETKYKELLHQKELLELKLEQKEQAKREQKKDEEITALKEENENLRADIERRKKDTQEILDFLNSPL